MKKNHKVIILLILSFYAFCSYHYTPVLAQESQPPSYSNRSPPVEIEQLSSVQAETTIDTKVEKVWYKQWRTWVVVGIGIIVAFAVFTPGFGCCEGGQNNNEGDQ